MAPHSSTLAWKIPWMEEPGGLQSMGSLRVRHDWTTSLSHIGEGNGNPLQCSCLENPRDGGAWWAAVYRVAQSWTRLKWLSSSSSSGHPTLLKKICVVTSQCTDLYVSTDFSLWVIQPPASSCCHFDMLYIFELHKHFFFSISFPQLFFDL